MSRQARSAEVHWFCVRVYSLSQTRVWRAMWSGFKVRGGLEVEYWIAGMFDLINMVNS
jgi:hypothetical protein